MSQMCIYRVIHCFVEGGQNGFNIVFFSYFALKEKSISKMTLFCFLTSESVQLTSLLMKSN